MLLELNSLKSLPQVYTHDRLISLNPYQDKFIFSKARYPALVAAWGTGKTMCAIEKARIASERFSKNLGVIFRKEYTDLRDSTIKDFETYTGLKLNAQREVAIDDSVIMFRHLEELNSIQNMNLGWFIIEQAEEIETDDIFFKLHGRLRRANIQHFGAIIANTRGKNWIHKLWKAQKQEDYELIEAKTIDNAHNLPPKFTADLEKLKIQKPEIWKRFVDNSWDDDDSTEQIFKNSWIEAAENRIHVHYDSVRRIVGIDVARMGKDKTVMYALENNQILGKKVLEHCDTMVTVAQAQLFAKQNKDIKNFAIDELNAGAGVVDRLRELGYNVIGINSAAKSSDPKFRNIRAEVYGYGAQAFEMGYAQLPLNDPDLRDQLTWAKWKKIDSSLCFQVEPKEDIVERYGRSPDDLEAYLYALWGLSKTKSIYNVDGNKNKNWRGGSYIPLNPMRG